MNDPKRILIVLLSLIVLVICVLGIKGHLEDAGYKTQVIYNTAIQASDETHVNYVIDTQQGNLLLNGKFSVATKDLTKYEEMDKAFTYVAREHEHYTEHSYSCGKDDEDTCYYWSWDDWGDSEQYASTISFYGRTYSTKLFNFDNLKKDTDCSTITPMDKQTGWFHGDKGCESDGYFYTDSDDRYGYEVVPQTFTATFLASSLNGGLHPVQENTITLKSESIAQDVKDAGNYKVILLWVFIIVVFILTCIGIVIAYKWVLEDGVWSTKD